MIGVVVSAAAIGFVLQLLDNAWGYGSEAIPAPQATMMKMLVEGIMSAELPWSLILIGVCVAIVMEILKVPVMPFAVGMYLPFSLNAGIMAGGLVRLLMDKRNVSEKEKKASVDHGILFTSGLIAGEGLMGVILAIFAVAKLDKIMNLSEKFSIGEIRKLNCIYPAFIIPRKSMYQRRKEKRIIFIQFTETAENRRYGLSKDRLYLFFILKRRHYVKEKEDFKSELYGFYCRKKS